MLEDSNSRKAAYERLLYALQGAVEPWGERVKNKALRKQYEIIAV